MKFFFVICMLFTGLAQAQVAVDQGDQFVNLKNGHKLFVDYTHAQKKGMPTFVFVNGLTYSTKDYASVAEYLKRAGYGVLLYDAFGMGKTLLENPLPTAPIDYVDQINELDELLVKMNVPQPYNLVGLSYGGGILIGYSTRYPKKVHKLFVMSPYTEVIENSKNIILKQIEWTKIFFPFNTATDEELAEFYTRLFAYQNYPIAEPTVLENPYKIEGVIRMTQGIMKYRPVDEAKNIPQNTLYLMIGALDQYVTKDVYDNFWKAATNKPCSYLDVALTEHKLSQATPYFVAKWLVLNVDSTQYCNGQSYIVNPFVGYMLPENGDAGFFLPSVDL